MLHDMVFFYPGGRLVKMAGYILRSKSAQAQEKQEDIHSITVLQRERRIFGSKKGHFVAPWNPCSLANIAKELEAPGFLTEHSFRDFTGRNSSLDKVWCWTLPLCKAWSRDVV